MNPVPVVPAYVLSPADDRVVKVALQVVCCDAARLKPSGEIRVGRYTVCEEVFLRGREERHDVPPITTARLPHRSHEVVHRGEVRVDDRYAVILGNVVELTLPSSLSGRGK